MNVCIRPARSDDLDACFAVQRAADLAAFPHIFPPDRFAFPAEEVRERWLENLSHRDRACWVVEDDDQIIGTAVLIGSTFDSIAVAPQKWGTGAAHALYSTVLKHAQSQGVERLDLWVMEQNTRARRFYAARGWKTDGRIKELPFPPHPLLVGYRLEPVP